MRALEGHYVRSAQKAFQGSKTKTGELLGKTEEKSPMRVIDLPSRQFQSEAKKEAKGTEVSKDIYYP